MTAAIRVRNLGKCYDLNGSRSGYQTLRERMVSAVAAPFRHWRKPSSENQNRKFWALDNVNLDIQPGEVVGIIGRNGAGKSTLLKILSRITPPSVGEARLRGRVGSLLEVGTGFHPELTGRENVYLNGAILGMTRREIARKFDEMVDFADVGPFLDEPVKRYSSGMYVRLAFAVAAHLEPEILLVDEVLAVGDAAFQKKCLGKMTQVANSGKTVLFVSHNMAAVQQLCPRSILIRSGKLADDGPTDRVIAEYLQDASCSTDGHFDLANHPARPAKYRPLIQALTLRSSDGRPTTQYSPEDSLHAELVIKPETPIREPRVALAIEDSFGRRITTVASYFEDQPLPDIDRPCRIQCMLPQLRLGAGRYLVSVSIATRYTGLLDSLDCAAWFEVVWNNNYGNGEPYSSIYGPVLSSSKWEHQEGA